VRHKSSETADIYIRVSNREICRIESSLDLISNENGCEKMIENVETWIYELGFGYKELDIIGDREIERRIKKWTKRGY